MPLEKRSPRVLTRMWARHAKSASKAAG